VVDDEDEENFESEDVELRCGREVSERSFGGEAGMARPTATERVERDHVAVHSRRSRFRDLPPAGDEACYKSCCGGITILRMREINGMSEWVLDRVCLRGQ
jgi:hypothetical protein